MQQLAVDAQLVEEAGVRQERIDIPAFQQRFNMIVEEGNKIFREEQRVAATGAGILYGGTVTDRYRAVFQNQLHGNAFTRLAHGGKSGGNRRAGIDESIVTRAVFNRLLVIKVE